MSSGFVVGRRTLLGGLFATLCTPGVVRAKSLMRLPVRPRLILWADGLHNDADALEALCRRSWNFPYCDPIDGPPVFTPDGYSIFPETYTGGSHIRFDRPISVYSEELSAGRVGDDFVRHGRSSGPMPESMRPRYWAQFGWRRAEDGSLLDCGKVDVAAWAEFKRQTLTRFPFPTTDDAIAIEHRTGVPRHELRPDVWSAPQDALASDASP